MDLSANQVSQVLSTTPEANIRYVLGRAGLNNNDPFAAAADELLVPFYLAGTTDPSGTNAL